MKHLFSILCLSIIFSISLMGQEKSTENIEKDILDCLVEMGKDTISTLNICESKYLNFNFQKDKGTFDFCEKRVVFFKGSTGTIKSTKKEYFDRLKYFVSQKFFLPSSSDQLIIFDKNEIKNVGYDVAVIVGSKKYLTKKEVINRLLRDKY